MQPSDPLSSANRADVSAPRPWVAQMYVARDFAIATAAALMVAAVGGMLGKGLGTVLIIVGSVVGGLLLLLTLLLFTLASRWQRQVDRMLGGEHYVHWEYGEQQWREYIDGQQKSLRWLPWIFAGMGLLMGLVMAGLFADDGDHIADQPLLTWTLLPLAGLAVIGLPGWIVCWRMRQGVKRMATQRAEIYIGPQGYFIGGSYCPWNTAGQTLSNISHRQGPPDFILVEMQVFNGQTTISKETQLPVPLGCESQVASLIEKLSARL